MHDKAHARAVSLDSAAGDGGDPASQDACDARGWHDAEKYGVGSPAGR